MRTALGAANYVAVVEIKSTSFEDKSYEQNIAVWNPQTQQSEVKTRHVNERVLVAAFEAKRVYKGPKSPNQAETPETADACGVEFTPGSTYLVYAGEEAEPTRISTNRCMRTALLTEAAKDIEVLDAATKPKSVVFQLSGASRRFNQAMDLVHSHAGADYERFEDPKLFENLTEAERIAADLAQSDPLSGFSQTIRAEITSMWRLEYDGRPVESLQEALLLSDDALRIAPNLAPAHVAKARTYAKSARFREAEDEIQLAFKLDPQLDSAIFLQAVIYRQSARKALAEQWIRKFIAASPQSVQKANGYEWMGRMYRDIAYKPEPYNRELYLVLAKDNFQRSIELDPADPWRLANFAGYLNEYIADFAGAEKKASMALQIADIPPAHRQLAAARYQALLAKADGMEAHVLQSAIDDIATETGISLEELVQADFRDVVVMRLKRLQRRVQQ